MCLASGRSLPVSSSELCFHTCGLSIHDFVDYIFFVELRVSRICEQEFSEEQTILAFVETLFYGWRR